MVRRLLAFALITMLGTGAAHAATACEDYWGNVAMQLTPVPLDVVV